MRLNVETKCTKIIIIDMRPRKQHGKIAVNACSENADRDENWVVLALVSNEELGNFVGDKWNKIYTQYDAWLLLYNSINNIENLPIYACRVWVCVFVYIPQKFL